MATPIKHRVSFVLHRHDRELDPQLQCRIKWGSSRFVVAVNTGYRVNPERWDSERQRCVPGSFHGARRIPAAAINDEIVRYQDVADRVFADFASRDLFPSVPDVRAAVQGRLSQQSEVPVEDVLSCFDRFCRERGVKNSWSDATHAQMRVVRHHLCEWRPALSWSDFDEHGLASYVGFLRDARGHKNSTVRKHLGYLRWFLGWADSAGLLQCQDYRSFKPKLKSVARTVVFLTWDELMLLWNFDAVGREFMGQVRDIFCFCCFTSLRYSDAMNLRWSDVGESSFSLTTVKTADPLQIQLNKWSTELLWRYADEGYAGDRVFPSISNQVMNRNLHELCRLCGIDDPVHLTWYRGSERHDEVHPKWALVSTHAGRRTFICNALAMGISPTVVMQWTGHADYESMKPYIGIADSSKVAAMSLFNRD